MQSELSKTIFFVECLPSEIRQFNGHNRKSLTLNFYYVDTCQMSTKSRQIKKKFRKTLL